MRHACTFQGQVGGLRETAGHIAHQGHSLQCPLALGGVLTRTGVQSPQHSEAHLYDQTEQSIAHPGIVYPIGQTRVSHTFASPLLYNQ